MNRLSPWIVRRLGPARLTALRRGTAGGIAIAAALPSAPQWAEDLRLFFTGWGGGLVFFLTLLG